MKNVLNTISERLKGSKKSSQNPNPEFTSEKMDEVFFYNPYKKKPEFRVTVEAAVTVAALRKLSRTIIAGALSMESAMAACDSLMKGKKDAV